MGFADRVTPGEQYLKELCEKLKKQGLQIALTGAEHTVPDFHKLLQKYNSDDYTSMFVRYQPDGVLTNTQAEKTYYFEAKKSDTIEKNAYLVYMNMQQCGCKVIICIKAKNDSEYYVPVEKIKLVDGNETCSLYPENIRLPVEGDGWISPRLLQTQKYYQWKNRFPMVSGTPYKYFDFGKMEQYRRE